MSELPDIMDIEGFLLESMGEFLPLSARMALVVLYLAVNFFLFWQWLRETKQNERHRLSKAWQVINSTAWQAKIKNGQWKDIYQHLHLVLLLELMRITGMDLRTLTRTEMMRESSIWNKLSLGKNHQEALHDFLMRGDSVLFSDHSPEVHQVDQDLVVIRQLQKMEPKTNVRI